jgi:hypothetical protein
MGERPTSIWQFCCDWYGSDEIYNSINRRVSPVVVPKDVRSREFAEWMEDQYRLAMRKGIELGMEWGRQRESEVVDG